MGNALYSFSEVRAKRAAPQTIYHIIEDVIQADDEACYTDMERFLRGAANTGSTQFDHARAVQILLEHDKRHGGLVHIVMQEKNLTEREIWDRLNRVLVKAGFVFRNGKMTGTLLEDKREETEEHEQVVSEPAHAIG